MNSCQDDHAFKSMIIVALMVIFSFDGFASGIMAQTKSKVKAKKVHIEAVAVTTVVDGINAGTGGLTIDASGNLYTADFGWRLSGPSKGGDKIMKVTPTGEVSVFCRKMRGASGNTIDANGTIFQSSIAGNYISAVSPRGVVTVVAKTGLVNPVGVAVGPKGVLYVCNCGGNSIQKITPDGKSAVFCKSPLFKTPNGITRGRDGTLYVCNFGNGDVLKVDTSGVVSRLATLPGGNNGHLTLLDDYLFVVARSGNRIYKVTLDGKATYFAGNGVRGKTDGSPETCSLSLPNAIVASPDGKYLYLNEISSVNADPKTLGPTRIRRIQLKKTIGGPAPKEQVVLQPIPALTKELRKARKLIGKQDFANATKALRSLIATYPARPEPHYLLGYSLHSQKHFAEARRMYNEAMLDPRFKVNCYYNIACSYSMEKNTEAAISSLKSAVAGGFSNFKQMASDTDFDNIKNDPRFQKLLGRKSSSH